MGRVTEALAALSLVLATTGCGGEPSPGAEEEDPGPGTELAEATLGPVRAVLHARPEEPRFGDRVHLTLDVWWEEGSGVEHVHFGARLGHLLVRGREGPLPAGTRHVVYRVEAEPERTGVNILRLPPLRFRAGGDEEGAAHALELGPVELEVAGLPPGEQPDLAALGTPLPPVRLPPRGGGASWWWAAGAAAVAALGAGLWLLRRHAPDAGPPPVDPVDEAQRALDELVAGGLPGPGGHGAFYLRLTAIVRRFVERTTGIHAPEQTTEEFLREMEARDPFPAGRRRALTEFLEAADLVKFAAQVPADEEVEGAVRAARGFCSRDAEEEQAA